MTIREYTRIFRRRWLVLLLAVVAGVMGSGAYYAARPPEYTASLQMYVSARPMQDPQDAFQGTQLAAERVKSYTKLGSSQRVADEVVRRLRLPMTGQDLASHVLTSSEADELVIDMYVTDQLPQRAADVANTAATVLSEVVDDLERPQTPGSLAPVVVRTIQPATMPLRPSSTGLSKTVALGLLVGLAIGVGIVLAHNAMDTSVTSLEQLESLTGLPVLGSVTADRHARSRRSLRQSGMDEPLPEPFRQLRTNLQSANGSSPARILLFASPTYRGGKTTTVVGLAMVIASTGKKVLLIDADLRNSKLADRLGLDGSTGLTDVLMGRATAEQATTQLFDSAVDVLPSGSSVRNPTELLVAPQMKGLLATACSRYDVVLIDSPPLLSFTDAAALAPAADGVVVVCRRGKTTSPQVVGALSALRSAQARVLGTVLTSMPPSRSLPLLERDEMSPAPQELGPVSSVPPTTPVRSSSHGAIPTNRFSEQVRPPMTNGETVRPSPRPANGS